MLNISSLGPLVCILNQFHPLNKTASIYCRYLTITGRRGSLLRISQLINYVQLQFSDSVTSAISSCPIALILIHVTVCVCVCVCLGFFSSSNYIPLFFCFLFNDALNTFYLRLYGVGHMVKDHSDSERGNPLTLHGLLFPINSKGSFICTIPQTG